MQLLPGLYQIGGDYNGLTWTGGYGQFDDANTYALQADGGVVLFDCGNGETFDQLQRNLARWDLSLDDVRACLLTHAHLDHAGGAHLLKQRGVELIAHDETAGAMACGDERCAGFLYHKTFTPCAADNMVSDGETISRCGLSIEAMHVPGHSMGCTAYRFEWAGEQVVISGDLIGTLGAGDFGWSGSIDFDKERYLDSLRRFAKIDADVMLPGHGPVYFGRPRIRVEGVLNQALMEWRE